MSLSSDLLDDSTPLYARVHGAIKDLISAGTLRPGDVVTEGRLAQTLNVSRTPVREAVSRLVSEGLLVVPPSGGLRVYAPTATDLADLYFTRAILEGAAAGLAATNVTDDFITRLSDICDRAEPFVAKGDVRRVVMLNGEFHHAVVAQSNNARIKKIIENLEPVIYRYRLVSLSYREHLDQGLVDHRELIEAFKNQNSTSVETLLRNHILRSGSRIVRAVAGLEVDHAGVGSPSMDFLLSF
jgi:DNA-binding GntR family transcriptional regulator